MPRVIRKQTPPVRKRYQSFKKYLRLDFSYRCAYCHVPELRCGGDAHFVVDHFRPRSKFPELSLIYSNLYYACAACNWYKGDQLVVDPCVEDFNDHWLIGADGVAKPLTPGGRRGVRTLRLNRPWLCEWRREKAIMIDRIRALAETIAELTGDEAGELVQSERVQKLLGRLEESRAKLERGLAIEFGDWWTLGAAA